MTTKVNSPKVPKAIKTVAPVQEIAVTAPPVTAPPVTAPPVTVPVLKKQFIKVQLKLSCPSPNRVNAEIARDAEMAGKAIRGSVHAGNKLFPGGDLNAITSFNQTLRNNLNALTTPLSDNGERLLPASKFQVAVDLVRNATPEWEQLVEEFLATYETRVENAKETLGDYFKEAAYPSKTAMREKFAIRFFYDKWQDTELDADIEKAIEASREAAMEDGKRIALSEMAQRLFAPLTGPADTILNGIAKGKDCKTKSNVVERLAGMADTLDSLNAYNDPTITDIAADIRATFAGTDRITASKLRTDEAARKTAAEKLAEIKAKFGI